MSDLRMPDLNRVIVAGRLTRDPELRYTSSNQPYCKLGLAISRVYKTKDGDKREDTVFVNVTAWRATAEFCGNTLRKGRPVMVEGRLTSNEWEDKATGQKRSAVEITADRVELLDWDNSGAAKAQPPARAQSTAAREPEDAEDYGRQDDIPF